MRTPARLGLRAAVITTVASAALVLTAAPAFALSRVSCTNSTNNYKANAGNATTCWSSPGSQSVMLFHVYGQHSGNWAGCYNQTLYNSNGTVNTQNSSLAFVKGVDFNFINNDYSTVDFIFHSSNGQSSNVCQT